MSTDERLRRLTRKLREELGEEICDALDDPTVVEIVVNDDGSLFIERLGERMVKVREGFDAKRAEAIIGTIASFLSTTCTRESPILSGEMPTLGAAFKACSPRLSPARALRSARRPRRCSRSRSMSSKGS